MTAAARDNQQASAWGSLRSRLLLLMLGIGLIPLVITGIVNISLLSNLLEERAVEQEQARIRNQAAEIERFLATTTSDVRLLAELNSVSVLADAIRENNSLRLQQARSTVENDFISFVEERDIGGQPIYQHVRYLNSEGFEFVRIDHIGGSVQRAAGASLNFRANRPYFIAGRALPAGDIYVSPIELFDEFGQIMEPHVPVLRYSTPVYSQDVLVGVIVTDVRAQGFLDLVTADLPEETTAFLVDEDGYYLAHPDATKRYGRDLETGIRLADDAPEIAATLANPTNGEQVLADDLAVYRVVQPPGQDDFRWLLVSERPLSVINAAVGQQQFTLVFGLLLVGGIVTAIALYVARSIGQPIAQLTETAGVIAGGDLDRRVEIERADEIGTLANAFNQMAGRLSDRITEINQKNKQLAIATAEAKEAARLKSEFLAIMSHELRTPLNAIMGFVGIMQLQGNLHGQQNYMLDRISANSERLLALINGVLDLSRIEAGRMELVPEWVNIRAQVERMRASMAVLATEKRLRFIAEVDSAVPKEIYIDHDALEKITSNLLSNAFKFTKEGHVKLVITQRDHDLIIQVSDTGIGIPQHMHEVIFENFRQADSSSKRQYGGSGLGLSIVQHLCTAMDGTVRVQSAPGKGSTFTVTLPLPEPETMEEGVRVR